MGGDGLVELNGGTGAIRFDGCSFVEDKDCPEGTIYYLNTDVVELQYLALDEPAMGGSDEMVDADITDGVDQIPLGIRIEALARTGDADKVMVKVYPQLVVKRPNMCGTRKSVAYS